MHDAGPTASEGGMPPIAIFTDFDGTLVELAPTPDSIDVPEGLAEELALSAEHLGGAMAILSGRAIADLDRYIPPLTVALAGSHGAERRRSDGSAPPPDVDQSTEAAQLATELQGFAHAHPGLLLEAKPVSVALHYRRAPDLADACLEAMQKAIDAHPRFHLLTGKMVIEARPRAVSKSAAMRAFLEEEPFRGRVPVFLGDDTTDEDGFTTAQELGGVGIKVGAGDSQARMRTPDPATARAIIRDLAARAAQR